MTKGKTGSTRRKFITQSTIAGIGTVFGMGIKSSLYAGATKPVKRAGSNTNRILSVKPRYHRWHVDPGIEWIETNTGYATLDWKIPLSQTALVLLDVWQRHYIKDTETRAEEIIQNKLYPLLSTCRQAGMTIIHAPAPHVALHHPNWVKLQTEAEMEPAPVDWPPQDFRESKGIYQAYARPYEPREQEIQSLPTLWFHPKTQPVGQEPVVATGEELHRYCKKQGLLFLLFTGFNTNACILLKDYGTIQMNNRGYGVILVRDCTTGMESKESQPTLAQTNGAILFLEMFGHYSVTSGEIITVLQA